MKKILSFALAMVMALSLSVTAFAAVPYDALDKSESQDVTAGYTAGKDNIPTVYSFTISWAPDENNNLAYTGEKATYHWNTTGLNYTKDTENDYTAAGWSGAAAIKVTVENCSNAALSVATTASSATYNLDITKDKNEKQTAASAAANVDHTDSTSTGEATSADITYTFKANDNTKAITGDNDKTDVIVGNISVTVSKPNA